MAADYLVVATGGAPLWIGTASLAVTGGVSAPPSNTVAPAISGTVAVGSTLTVSTGTWSNSPAGYTYQWKRSATSGGALSDIVGATSSTYVLQAGDETYYIVCTVTATNAVDSTSADAAEVGPVAAASDPTADPLVQATDITYLGDITMPAWISSTHTDPYLSAYGGYGGGLNEDGTKFYLSGRDSRNDLNLFNLPSIGGTATIAREPVSITAMIDTGAPADQTWQPLGTALVWNSRLILSRWHKYDAGGNATASHIVGTPDLNTVSGTAVAVDAPKLGAASAYMGVIPSAWRSYFSNKPCMTGCSGVSNISASSYGQAVFAFDPDDVGVNDPAPLTTMVYYPDNTHQIFGVDGNPAHTPSDIPPQSDYFSWGSTWRGIGFPSGKRSVLFVGRQGYGDSYYGIGTSNIALHGTLAPDAVHYYWYDPEGVDAEGNHDYPWRIQFTAFDANDLAAVAAGTMNSWDVQPHAYFALTDIPSTVRDVRSAWYDDDTRKFYIACIHVGGDIKIHVYQIAS